MIDRILDPLTELPKSSSTAKALAAIQGKTLGELRGAAQALDDQVDRVRSSKDLTDTAKSRRSAELRQEFVDNFTAAWNELLDRGALAQKLLATHYGNDAIRIRGMLEAKPADVAGRASLLRGLTSTDLYQGVIEAGRTDNTVLAALILSEVRRRLGVGEIGLGDAAAIMEVGEEVPLPAAELESREALQDVQDGSLEADSIYRSSVSGQSEDPVARLARQRRSEAIRGALPEPSPPMSPSRLSRENRERIGLK